MEPQGVESSQRSTVGDRVVDGNGFRATVRYVGPVCTAKDPTSLWIGVEFDDAGRGKHDGAVQKPDGSTLRYFTCGNGGSGSFLKQGKFSVGIPMAEALRQQYVDMNAPLLAPENLLPDAYASTSKGGKKAIEFYGESKIRRRQQVDTLHHCTLRECGISKAGELSVLSEAAGSFVHVDLKANLLSDWQEVGLIASQMPLLEILSVGSNRFRTPEEVPSSLESGACDHLRVLEVTSCGITSWSQVAMLGEWAPSLEELYAADNSVSDVVNVVAASTSGNTKVEGFRRLKSLDLSETGLTSWEQVACFSALPVLATLLLNHNRVTDVVDMTSTSTSTATSTSAPVAAKSPGPASGDQVEGWREGDSGVSGEGGDHHECLDSSSSTTRPPFAVLEAISLSGNQIEEWGAIDRLAGLPSLRSLRFNINPVTSGLGASESRAACIARLSKLSRVNASEVGARERADAEKVYLRSLHRDLEKAQESVDAGGGGLSKDQAERLVADRNPRYRELWALHSESMAFGGKGTGAGQQGGSMASGMAQVTLTSLAAASCTVEPMKKRLPASSMTVGKLKQLCKRLFKIDTDQQILSHRPEPGALLSTLDDDDKTLSYFCVGDGSEVLVNEVDERQQQRDKERARREEENRMAEQLRHAEALGGVRRGQVAQETASAQLAAGR
ncbi:unnamed protein product [Pylaiella littoralis]